MNRITYYSEIDDYAKFIEELKKINFLYAKYVECKQKKSIFRGLITYNRLPGNTIRKIDDIYAKRDDGNDKNSKYYDTIQKLFHQFFIFLKFFKNDIDENDTYQKNWYDYSKEILEKLNKKLEKKSCQLPNNGTGNRPENNLGISNNRSMNTRRNMNARRNMIRSMVTSRRNANNTYRSNGSNLRARRNANSRKRRGNNGNNTSQRINL